MLQCESGADDGQRHADVAGGVERGQDPGPVIRGGDGDHYGEAASDDSAEAGAGHGRSDQEERQAWGRCPGRGDEHGQADDDRDDAGRQQADAGQLVVAVCTSTAQPKVKKIASPVRAGEGWWKGPARNVPVSPVSSPPTAKDVNTPVVAATNCCRRFAGAVSRCGWYLGRGWTAAWPSGARITATAGRNQRGEEDDVWER